MMKKEYYLLSVVLICCGLCAEEVDVARTLPNALPGAAAFMKQHPQSDLNGDGSLTYEEKEVFCAQKATEMLGGGYTFERHLVPMRDGVKLATGVLTPEGEGPFPVVITRTAYGIWGAVFHGAPSLKDRGVVFICQDPRGDGESEGKGTADFRSFDNEINDGHDCVDWVSKQSFCNGRIGMMGQSGHGFCAYMAYLAKHPALTSVSTNVSGGNAYLYWTYHNGVRREMYNWLSSRNIGIPQWPKPTITYFDKKVYDATVAKAAKGNDTVFIAKTGWYDIFSESALDYFEVFADSGKVFVQVDASGHGNMSGRKPPGRPVPAEWALPELVDSLESSSAEKSRLVYYLMGDSTDPKAPGNEYKMTEVWPVPHEPVSFYLKADGTLTEKKPQVKGASMSFKYDPRNPVSSEGGDVFIHQGVGPKDQRVHGERADILRFRSAPLEEPLEITGKILADLYIKTDVEDTTFTAKLIDVYPDGYEAIVRDSIIMGRFHEGLDKGAKLEKGQVYKLTMDLWSTAIVINKGHRLAVHISSSNSPKYEVHPNTFDAVNSFEHAPIADQTVIMSSDYPSRIILPVVK